MHWGWYWRVKKHHIAKSTCEAYKALELDSFSMFKNYYLTDLLRTSSDKCSLEIPRYALKAYLQKNDNLLVHYQKGSYIIPVERKSCNYGGYYYFFHCPLCDKRNRKLYCLDGQYQCRKCGNLGYYSQRLRPANRFLLQESKKVIRKIKQLGGNIRTNLKPPRMHKKTFQAYKNKGKYLEAKYFLAGIKEAQDYNPGVECFDSYLEDEANYTIEKYKRRKLRNPEK